MAIMKKIKSYKIYFYTAALVLLFAGNASLLKAQEPTQSAASEKSPASAPATQERFPYPATEEGLRQMLEEFLDPEADHAALTQKWVPTYEDYLVFFTDETSESAWSTYQKLYKKWGAPVVKPKEKHNDLTFHLFDTTKVNKGDEETLYNLPGGYKKIHFFIRPGNTMATFKFIEKGKKLGLAFNTLAYVNGHWVIFPKPHRFLKAPE